MAAFGKRSAKTLRRAPVRILSRARQVRQRSGDFNGCARHPTPAYCGWNGSRPRSTENHRDTEPYSSSVYVRGGVVEQDLGQELVCCCGSTIADGRLAN